MTPADPQRSAGIVAASRSDLDMAALFARLKEQGFICSLRENRLRIAPHFYNSEEEIERFCAVLPDRVEKGSGGPGSGGSGQNPGTLEPVDPSGV